MLTRKAASPVSSQVLEREAIIARARPSSRVGMRQKLSEAALGTMRYMGVFDRFASSRKRTENLLILCYHGISMTDEHEWLPQLYMSADQFRTRLQALRGADMNVLPLEEALERLKTKSLPPRSVVLTFDDGFYDYFDRAVPILSEFGYPCTLYLTTHYAKYRLPIIGLVLDYLFWKSGESVIELPEFGIDQLHPIGSYFQRQRVVQQLLLWAETHRLNTVAKSDMAASIASRLNLDYRALIAARTLQIMSPEEIRQSMRAGTDIQLHTHRHRTPRDRELFRQEIEVNRDQITEITGKRPVHFCYPSGDYVPEFFGWLESLGVESATTCEAGLASRGDLDMKLPRVLDHAGLSQLRFESLASGMFVPSAT